MTLDKKEKIFFISCGLLYAQPISAFVVKSQDLKWCNTVGAHLNGA